MFNQPTKTATGVASMPAPAQQNVNAIAKEDEFQDFGFTGTDGIEAQDLKIPDLILIQNNSNDILNKNKNAKPGMIYNTVTEQVYDISEAPLIVVPFLVVKNYHVCEPSEDGEEENLVNQIFELPDTVHHVPNTSYKMDENDPNGYRIYECYNYFVALPDDSTARILFKKSKFKVAKKWNTLLKQKGVGVPAFRHKYALSNFVDHFNNRQWFNFNVVDAEPCTAAEYNNVGNLAQAIIPIAKTLTKEMGAGEHE